MNKDNETFTATPVFYTSDNDPDSYWILESQVLTQNNEGGFPEPLRCADFALAR